MIKQFVPEEFCLKCRFCCRFKEDNSVWSPCLLDQEVQELMDKKDIPAASIFADRRLHLINNPEGEGFICPFLEVKNNQCKIYSLRPLECQLYPFLLNLRKGKVLLTVDLNCPYLCQKIDTPEANDYIIYLTELLNTLKMIKLLKENPQIIQAYEEVREVAEINLPYEIK